VTGTDEIAKAITIKTIKVARFGLFVNLPLLTLALELSLGSFSHT
jgi:hypothetical protein